MKLPIIRSLTDYIEQRSSDDVSKTIEVLEHISQSRGLKDEELDTIGEVISNLCGSVEVANMIQSGKNKNEALNHFMQRVLGSIDKNQ